MRFRYLLLPLGLAFLPGPAFAAWDRVGVVDIDHRLERESQYGGFGGPVTQLQLRATGQDVACRSIRGETADGQRIELWRGTLRESRMQAISLPRGGRDLRRIDFLCRATGRPGAQVEIYADTSRWDSGPSRPDYGRPDYGRPDHGRSDWNGGSGWNENEWIALGAARFAAREGDTTVNGANGRAIRQVGLRSRGGDAQCRAVVIRFTNGERVSLPVNEGQVMREERLYRVDLPGRRRNILRLALACRAVNADYVSIQVYAGR